MNKKPLGTIRKISAGRWVIEGESLLQPFTKNQAITIGDFLFLLLDGEKYGNEREVYDIFSADDLDHDRIDRVGSLLLFQLVGPGILKDFLKKAPPEQTQA